MTENVPGSGPLVNESRIGLEAGGLCPSPPSVLSAPEDLGEGRIGVGDRSPALPRKTRPETPDPFHGSQHRQAPLYLVHTANLGSEELPEPLYKPVKCDPKFIVLGCNCPVDLTKPKLGNKRHIVPSACMSLDCEHCWSHVSWRRANMIFYRLLSPHTGQTKSYRTPTVIYTIFTLPEGLRKKFLNKKYWQYIRVKAWAILRDKFGAKFGVEASHPTGDQEEFNFQPHMNFLWIQKPGFKPFLDKEKLWKAWGKVLHQDEARVWSQYSDRLKRIRDWAWYVGRSFPGTHEWTGSMRWYGTYPKQKQLEHTTCAECGSRYKLIGFISATIVEDFWDTGFLSGRDPPWYDANFVQPLKPRKGPPC